MHGNPISYMLACHRRYSYSPTFLALPCLVSFVLTPDTMRTHSGILHKLECRADKGNGEKGHVAAKVEPRAGSAKVDKVLASLRLGR